MPASASTKKRKAIAAYERKKERANRRLTEQARAARDIGPLPKIADPARRRSCRRDFRRFCETYLGASFPLAWSRDHLRVIARIEAAVLRGEQLAIAMPRGRGKTTLILAAAVWAMLYGHRRFVMVVGATGTDADDNLESIVVDLAQNELLIGDFPEVCYPIARLDGIGQRAPGQTLDGKPTRITIAADELIFPTIKKSKVSGSIVRTRGITGAIRGSKHKLADGTVLRPDLVLIDDPQTEESAWSPSQCETRTRTINGAILGLAGPGKAIAALMAVTIIRRGDLADQVLNRAKNPQWNGERTKMVYRWPTRGDLWEEYCRLWNADREAGAEGTPTANAFYISRRVEMDEGSEVDWPENYRVERGEVSAIQQAYNIRLERKDEAFFAEYQNEPLEAKTSEVLLDADAIASKVNGHARHTAPIWATRLTAFIDVQQELLYYAVLAFGEDFTPAVIDYGTEPEQSGNLYTLRTAPRRLEHVAPSGSDVDAQLWYGLQTLTRRLIGRDWRRDDGGALALERLMIDANWGDKTTLVYEFCRSTNNSHVITPSHGKYVGASGTPMSEWTRRDGERVGLNWRYGLGPGRAVRHVTFDTNFWKSILAEKLRAPIGERGALTLFGSDPNRHRMFAAHMTSEVAVKTEGRGRSLLEWKAKPGIDNHWLDCVVGACVAASMQGVVLPGHGLDATARTSAGVGAAWRRAKMRERRG